MENAESNENLLPQVIENTLELGLRGSTISLNDFLIASGKTAAELSEVLSDKICSLSANRAQTIWKALDEESKSELTYPDYGSFNLSLIEKLGLPGSNLQKAFVSIHARSIFELDAAPLSTPIYINAFTTIQSELLATCKQLLSAKPGRKDRLIEFLSSFEPEFLASVVRHEIARYFIDEEGAQFEFDLVEDETGKVVEYTDEHESDEETDWDAVNYPQLEALEEFNSIFIKDGTVPSCLEFTSWVQRNAHETYVNVLNFMTFFASQSGIPVWERPNPTEYAENSLEEREIELKSRDENRFAPDLATAFRDRSNGNALVSVESQKEFHRIIRVYCITHPLKTNFLKVGQQDFQAQGKVIATILGEAGMETCSIQTFDQIRKAVCDAVGFTSVKQWVNKQYNPQRLIISSGNKWVFDEMKVLGCDAFGKDAILLESLEESRSRVQRLYGWLSLVKIFWNIADQKRRFTDLATIKNDTLYWEEDITCCTLIFQLVLETDKLFFSLQDVGRFCELSRGPQWVDTMKQSFRDLAEQHSAISALPIFYEYINNLSQTATNIFRIGNVINLSTKKEREIVAAVKAIAEEHVDMFLVSLGKKKKDEKEVKEEIGFHFAFKTMTVPGISGYRKEADSYLDFLCQQVLIPDGVDMLEFERMKKLVK